MLAAAATLAPRLWSFNTAEPGALAAAAPPATLPQAAMVSAIDMALWDLHAQQRHARLVDVIGGARREVLPVYANINRRTLVRTCEGFAQSARDALAAGYVALKIAPFDEVSPGLCERGDGKLAMQEGLARIAAVRTVAGANCRLMVDCHWRFDEVTAAHMIDAAAEHHVHWIECPIPEIPGNLAALVRLRARANAKDVLLAGMEEGIGCASFVSLLHRRRVRRDDAGRQICRRVSQKCSGARSCLRITALRCRRTIQADPRRMQRACMLPPRWNTSTCLNCSSTKARCSTRWLQTTCRDVKRECRNCPRQRVSAWGSTPPRCSPSWMGSLQCGGRPSQPARWMRCFGVSLGAPAIS